MRLADIKKKSNNQPESGKYMSSVKVGPKGQIVIPKEAREMFGIKPGDTLLLLADVNRGIAVQRLDYFDKIADEIFLRANQDPAQSKEKEDGLRFVPAIQDIQQPSRKMGNEKND